MSISMGDKKSRQGIPMGSYDPTASEGGGGGGGGEQYILPTATSTRLGGVKIGAGITVTDGKISTNALPDDVVVSTTETTSIFTSMKAVKFAAPMVDVGENLVTSEDELYLHQGSIEAGTNITVEPTATGIRINSTASGGGEGTTDYNDLTNQPSIGGTTLVGDLKLAAPLHIQKNYNESLKSATYDPSTYIAKFAADSGEPYTGGSSTTYIYFTSGSVGQSDGSFTSSSYIEFPYALNDIIRLDNFDSNTATTNSWFALGYKTDLGFKPVLIRNYRSNTWAKGWFVATDPFIRYKTLYYRKVQDAMTNTSFTASSSIGGGRAIFTGKLYYDMDEQLYKMQSVITTSGTYTTFDASIQAELEKIDTIRFFATTTSTSGNIFVKRNPDNISLETCSAEDIDALETVVPPEVISNSTIAVGNWEQSYSSLAGKPKINGVELDGNVTVDDVGIQRVLTATSGIQIKGSSEWDLLNSSYDPDTQIVTTNSLGVGGTSTGGFSKAPGLYVDNTSVIPKVGVITPFYLNTTTAFGYNTITRIKYILGTRDNSVFKPKIIISPVTNSTHVFRVTNVTADSSGIISLSSSSIGTWSNEASSSTTNSPYVASLYVGFNDGVYTVKAFYISSSTIYRQKALFTGDQAALFNECNACWIIPDENTMCGTTNTQILPGDHMASLMVGEYNTRETAAIQYLPDNNGSTYSLQIGASVDNETIKINDQGQLYAVQPESTGSDKYGIRGDYCTKYGILDCPNGLVDFNATGKTITINPGIVLKCPNRDLMTTLASAVTVTLTSTGVVTIFYAGGEVLECGEVYFQEDEPDVDGAENYQAWWKPSAELWYFRSNDTGNVFRPIEGVTPLADIKMNEANILRVDYIGYRIFNDDIIPQLSDIENLQEVTGALQTSVNQIDERLGGFTIRRMTQADYDALATKDENTLYVIIDQEAFVTKAEAAHAAMPSSKLIAMTVGASGTKYTPPTDGYFALEAKTATGLRLITEAMDIGSSSVDSTIPNKYFIPISAKQTLVINYYAGDFSSGHFNFVYLNGNAPA